MKLWGIALIVIMKSSGDHMGPAAAEGRFTDAGAFLPYARLQGLWSIGGTVSRSEFEIQDNDTSEPSLAVLNIVFK